MRKVRLIVLAVATAFLVVGYLASQYAYLNGEAAEYAAKVDTQPVVLLSLMVFVVALALFLIPDREEPEP